jgi:hypothetical protein
MAKYHRIVIGLECVPVTPQYMSRFVETVSHSLAFCFGVACLSPPEDCRKALRREISAGLFFLPNLYQA